MLHCPRCHEEVGPANVRCRNCDLPKAQFAEYSQTGKENSENPSNESGPGFTLGRAKPGSNSGFSIDVLESPGSSRFELPKPSDNSNVDEPDPRSSAVNLDSSTALPRAGNASDLDVQLVDFSTSHAPQSSDDSTSTPSVLPITCENCSAVNQVPRSLATTAVLCVQCGRQLIVSREASSSQSETRTSSVVRASGGRDRRKELKRSIEKALAIPVGKLVDPKFSKTLSKSEWKSLQADVVAVVDQVGRPDLVETAVEAVAQMASSADKRAVGFLVEQAESFPDAVRARAKQAWGELKLISQFESLLQSLINDVPETYPGIIQGLGTLGDRRVTRTLVTVGAHWDDLRECSIGAIVELGAAALPELITLAERADKTSWRPVVAEALGRLKDPQAIPVLANILKNDRSSEVRATACKAMASIEDRSVLPPLVAALRDKAEVVRIAAIESLQAHPRKRIVPALVHVLGDESPIVRRQAARLIGRCGVVKAVSPLSVLLEDPEADVRIAVLESLALLGDMAAVPQLGFLLNEAWQNKNEDLLSQVASVLGEIRDPRAILPLLNTMPGSGPVQQSRIVAALGQIGDASVLPALVDIMTKGATPAVRTAAVTSIGRLGVPESVEPLSRAVKAGQPLKSAAVAALGDVPCEESVLQLMELLDDNDANIRRLAAVSLGSVGNESVLRKLRPLTRDSDSRVASAAAESLKKLGAEDESATETTKADKKVASPKKKKIKVASTRKKISFKMPQISYEQLTSLDMGELVYLAKSSPLIPGVVIAVLALGVGAYFFAGALGDAVAGRDSSIIARGVVAGVSISGDGEKLAVARTLDVIDVMNTKGTYLIDKKAACGDGVLFDATGANFYVSDEAGGAFWSLDNGTSKPVDRIALLKPNNARTKALGATGNQVLRLDLATGATEKLGQLQTTKGLLAMGVNDDATQALFGYASGEIGIWNEADGKIVGALQGPATGVFALAYSADGSKLAVGGRQGEVQIFEKGNPQPVVSIEVAAAGGTAPPVKFLRYRDDGTLLVVSSYSALLVDPSSGAVQREFKIRGPADMVSVSVDCKRLAVGNEDANLLHVYDIETGELAWKVPVE